MHDSTTDAFITRLTYRIIAYKFAKNQVEDEDLTDSWKELPEDQT